MRFFVFLPALMALACQPMHVEFPEDTSVPLEPTTWFRDADSDGHGNPALSFAAGAAPAGYTGLDDDCDDGDAAIFPGAGERCNGLDDECDGEIDEDAVDPPTWAIDVDGDGYGDADSDGVVGCQAPAGHVASSDDCDDADPAIYPGADEVCDGVDQDCDGEADEGALSIWYTDLDGDGWGDGASASEACTAPTGTMAEAGDCDDGDPDINPDQEEICGDGLDNDCDGSAGPCAPLEGEISLADADAVLRGEQAGDLAGYAVVLAGDVDADGFGDILVGAPGQEDYTGAVYLVRGPVSGEMALAAADARLVGEESWDKAGFSVAGPGDVNGDGFDDVLVGAPAGGRDGWGVAYLLYGPLSGEQALLDADGRWEAEAGWDDLRNTGVSLAGAGDVNGDGLPDMLIGADDDFTGGVYLVHGSREPDAIPPSLADASAFLESWQSYSYHGGSVSGDGDVNGDGFADFLVGSSTGYPGSHSSDPIVAFLVHGPVSGEHLLTDVGLELAAEGTLMEDTRLCVAMAGDTNNDGLCDLLLGWSHGGTIDEGLAFLVEAPVEGPIALADAQAVLSGESANGHAGDRVASAGDMDGDGFDDVLVGARWADAWAGASYLVHGPLSGEMDLSGADAKLLGNETGDLAGCALAGGSDVNNDGLPDLLLGAYGEDTNGHQSGSAYVLLGGMGW